MPDRTLPDRPNLQQYKKQAKELARRCAEGEAGAMERVRRQVPRLRGVADEPLRALALSEAQLAIAREHNFASWPKFAAHVAMLERVRSLSALTDPTGAFLEVACVDVHGSHAEGTLEYAEMILRRYPEVATANVYTAAVLGNSASVQEFLRQDAGLATRQGGPRSWDALLYLCFSRYLRLDRSRAEAFTETARVLLEAGADANTRWWETIDEPPRQIPETAIYGAAGVAQHAGVTQLLLEHGADPNDEETPYHVAEGYDNAVLGMLLASGRLNARSLATLLVRKLDWHDARGVALALQHGADPNFRTVWAMTPFQHAIRRDNALPTMEQLLEHGADPLLTTRGGRDAFQLAAVHGRGDVLRLFAERGLAAPAGGAMEELAAACALGDLTRARAVLMSEVGAREELRDAGGALLARFSGVGELAGVRCLLELGVPVDAVWREGDGYFDEARDSTALHVAAWRGRHEVVAELLARGADVGAVDGRGRTPLQLAVKACVDSYWKASRRPDSVAMLLAAGASAWGVDMPTGYDEIDRLLEPRDARNLKGLPEGVRRDGGAAARG